MSAPTTPPSAAKSRRKLVLVAVVVAVPLLVLLIPAIVYGGFTVPLRKITFNETTGSLITSQAQVASEIETVTVYEYMFSIRSQGRVRTADTDVSTTRGTTNVTMRLELRTPTNQTLEVGRVNISGAMGTRSHTIYLGVDEGVRVPGTYTLNIFITASVAPVGGLLQVSLTATVAVNFNVS